jgi:hypothetical protein
MFYINNKGILISTTSGDGDPRRRFISVRNGNGEEMSPASIRVDPCGDFFLGGEFPIAIPIWSSAFNWTWPVGCRVRDVEWMDHG